MNKGTRLIALIMICLSLFLSVPMTAFAADALDPDMCCTLSIHYEYGSTALTETKFEIYKAADRTDYAVFQLTEPFSSYPVHVNNQDQKGWDEAALALSGYAARDKLVPMKTGETDGNGDLTFDDLKPGLYLVVPSQCSQGNYMYTSSPFFVALPGLDTGSNTWEQQTSVEPKCTRNIIEDTDITRKVLKKWDDKGYETVRPEKVIVQLLCDGEVYDTVTLNQNNQWSCSWTNLNAQHEWMVVEKEAEHYEVHVDRQGITFTITNKYIVPAIGTNLPVQKRVIGDKPHLDGSFSFLLAAKDNSCPMPDGSNGMLKEISITGAGTVNFGEISFTKPGTYVYTVSEKNKREEGYIYDSSVYTVTFEVSDKGGSLSFVKTIKDSKGNVMPVIEFTNNYKIFKDKLPQTGMLWWPVPVLLCAGLVFFIIGAVRRRRCGR